MRMWPRAHHPYAGRRSNAGPAPALLPRHAPTGFEASCKTVFVMSLLHNLVAEGHRTLIFSQSRVMWVAAALLLGVVGRGEMRHAGHAPAGHPCGRQGVCRGCRHDAPLHVQWTCGPSSFPSSAALPPCNAVHNLPTSHDPATLPQTHTNLPPTPHPHPRLNILEAAIKQEGWRFCRIDGSVASAADREVGQACYTAPCPLHRCTGMLPAAPGRASNGLFSTLPCRPACSISSHPAAHSRAPQLPLLLPMLCALRPLCRHA